MVLARCGLPKRSPLSSYDTPASQRFDHDSSFLQLALSTALPVRAIYFCLGTCVPLICLDAFSTGYIHFDMHSYFQVSRQLTRHLHSRQHGVAVMALMIMTRSA